MFNDLFIWLAPGMEQENKGKTLHRSDMAYMTELIPFFNPTKTCQIKSSDYLFKETNHDFCSAPKSHVLG